MALVSKHLVKYIQSYGQEKANSNIHFSLLPRMFVVAMISPTAIAQIGYQYYIVYAVISLTIPPAVYLFYPETMNRSLEDVDQLFHDAPTILSAVKMSRHATVGENRFSVEDKGMVEEVEE